MIRQATEEEKPDLKKYDYGFSKNFAVYGQKEAPDYNLELIRTKLYMYHGADDQLSNDDDIDMGIKRMVNAKVMRKLKIDNFGHATFFIGEKMDRIVKMILEDLGGDFRKNKKDLKRKLKKANHRFING